LVEFCTVAACSTLPPDAYPNVPAEPFNIPDLKSHIVEMKLKSYCAKIIFLVWPGSHWANSPPDIQKKSVYLF